MTSRGCEELLSYQRELWLKLKYEAKSKHQRGENKFGRQKYAKNIITISNSTGFEMCFNIS